MNWKFSAQPPPMCLLPSLEVRLSFDDQCHLASCLIGEFIKSRSIPFIYPTGPQHFVLKYVPQPQYSTSHTKISPASFFPGRTTVFQNRSLSTNPLTSSGKNNQGSCQRSLDNIYSLTRDSRSVVRLCGKRDCRPSARRPFSGSQDT